MTCSLAWEGKFLISKTKQIYSSATDQLNSQDRNAKATRRMQVNFVIRFHQRRRNDTRNFTPAEKKKSKLQAHNSFRSSHDREIGIRDSVALRADTYTFPQCRNAHFLDSRYIVRDFQRMQGRETRLPVTVAVCGSDGILSLATFSILCFVLFSSRFWPSRPINHQQSGGKN